MKREEAMRKPHNDVPDKTILRYVLQEKGALQAENAELKHQIKLLETQLGNKAKAITAFKAWQAKVAEYHYSYWLNQGIQLMQEVPNERLTATLQKLLTRNDVVKRTARKLLSQIQGLEAIKQNLEQILEEELKS